MPKQTKLEKALNTLTEEDKICLQHLYLYRTLTISQIINTIYHLKPTQTRKRNAILRRLTDLQVVELMEWRENEHVLFLTNLGISIVRQTKDIPSEIFDEDAKVVKRGYYTAAELKMKKNLINHQTTKNGFMIKFDNLTRSDSFQSLMNKCHLKFSYQYFDEKYLTNYITMRPDAVLHTGNTDFFIEEDMATESAKQLTEKWRHYFEFMQTREFFAKENKIVVLFLTDNIVKESSLRKRKALVRETALKVLGPHFKNYFDMIIGSQDEILKIMPDLVVESYGLSYQQNELFTTLSDNGWTISPVKGVLLSKLNHENYLAYMRQKNSKGQIIEYNQRLMEFVLDDYQHQEVGVQSRILNQERDSILFHNEFHRALQYIIIIPNMDKNTLKSVYNDILQVHAEKSSSIFYTTYDRLKTLPFNEALFQFDGRNRIYHFKNSELVQRIYE